MTSSDVLAQVDAALGEHFAQSPVRASISFLGVDPIEVLRFEPIPGERAYLTLGMSRQPMTPASELTVSAHGPRAELMLHLRDPADHFTDVWRQLAVLAAAPAVEGVVYSVGMTVDLGQVLASSSTCTGALVTAAAVPLVETSSGPVEILLAVPATQNELAWARVRGAAALQERWSERGVDLLDLSRAGVDLD